MKVFEGEIGCVPCRSGTSLWAEAGRVGKGVGLRNYAVVATNAKRYERALEKDRTEQARMKQVCHLLNCKIWPQDVDP